MASTTVKPYPHVQINVKDNSIANVQFVETLPVHRPLYVMRTQEGPVGVPKWCNTYSEAVALFGEETFNPANKTYFSRAAQFLLNTMTYNGAFIVRYLPKGDATAKYVLFVHVDRANVDSYEYDTTTGKRTLTYDPMQNEWIELPKMTYALTSDTVFPKAKNKRYFTRTGTGTTEDPYVYTIYDYSKVVGEEITADTYYEGTAQTVDGVKISFGTRTLTASDVRGKLTRTVDTNGSWFELPIMEFEALYSGAYGNDLAIRLFYTDKSNDSADVTAYGTLFYNIGFLRRDYTGTTTNSITDIYGRENAAFAANPETVNPDSGAYMGITDVLDKGFSDSAHVLPMNIVPYTENFNAVGLVIAAYEDDVLVQDGYGNDYITVAGLNGWDSTAPVGALTAEQKQAVKGYYFATNPSSTYTNIVKDLTLGYKVNCVSCTNLIGSGYPHAVIGEYYKPVTTSATVTSAVAYLNSSAQMYLGTITDELGKDGTFNADSDTKNWASDDKAMYDFCNLQLHSASADSDGNPTWKLNDVIVESLHYPFTHIFDLGFSIRTKKAILKFLDVRDDFMAIMSSQVLMSDGSGRAIKVNDQAADEANVETLRSYALLMRESVLYGTDCMRAAIYCHAGKLAEGTYTEYVPFTYWDALQYAKYGNLTYMKADEPRGLPNSYNLLFKEWNWNNYRADAQSRVWDAGANYVQYADMTRLFYPALRTVYRASTSVLVDEWFVAAVVYAKYVCKRAWAQFSGRNDAAATLQGAIKQYLDKELASLFNNKYTFTTSVYQTADELELGYVQHVKLSITSPATMRVLDVDIEVNREGFVAEE